MFGLLNLNKPARRFLRPACSGGSSGWCGRIRSDTLARSIRSRLRAGGVRRHGHAAGRLRAADVEAISGDISAWPQQPSEDIEREMTELVDPPVPSP